MKRWPLALIILSLLLSACGADDELLPPIAAGPTQATFEVTPVANTLEPGPTASSTDSTYLDPDLLPEQRAEALLKLMTLEEKIGQMTQVEKGSILSPDITKYYLGSLLSGGGGSPAGSNTPEGWATMTDGFQKRALETRLAIPLIYGVDAVHGHGNLYGATIFPHNIGLGAADDPDLMERIGRATAAEMAATGIWWDFAPVVAVPQDIRWGRTYEGYGENTDLVTRLATAYVQGLQGERLSDPLSVLATPKHFIGDGGTAYATATTSDYLIDQGDTQMDEGTLRTLFLPPYQAVVDSGALSIMVSFSSWNGKKMHAHKYLLTDLLKGELGFKGFLISDWQAIDQLPGDYYSDVVTAINAGLDMIMVPYDYVTFIATLTRAVKDGRVPLTRIDDAVRRILMVKFALGLFEHPYADPVQLALVGAETHRAIAREAVRKSLVLLRNVEHTLPIAKDIPLILVAGQAADDIGLQAGGWTIEWQGLEGAITPGTTILDGIRAAVSPQTRVEYERFGNFERVADSQGAPILAEVGVVVVAEIPYAEGVGDQVDLSLAKVDQVLIDKVRAQSQRLVVVLLSGRPLILAGQLPAWDALVAAWLPGSEGAGVAEVLFGDYEFTGRLPYSWPRSMQQLPFDFETLPTEGCDAPLFSYGYGLRTTDPTPALPVCAEP